MTVLITGATGFVGSALCKKLRKEAVPVRGAVRTQNSQDSTETVTAGNLSSVTDWTSALRNVEQVVHLAARVHMMNDRSSDPLAEFIRTNVDGTANLARQAADAGVRRFVFLSSIKVNGESTEAAQPFTADDVPTPQDPYGISKHEAEKLLRIIASESDMEVVIIRPPLVYGPGVKANFESMMRWLALGVPMPFGAITENRRSLVALDNLLDLIGTCLNHPAAANQTFLASDGEDISTADLLTRMGMALGRPANLFSIPPALLKLGATMIRKQHIYQRLCGSLQLDISKTHQLLGWTPPVTLDAGLSRVAEGFFNEADI